jgi:hypothetical protein
VLCSLDFVDGVGCCFVVLLLFLRGGSSLADVMTVTDLGSFKGRGHQKCLLLPYDSVRVFVDFCTVFSFTTALLQEDHLNFRLPP